MSLFVAGETGDPCARVLCAAIDNCEKAWAGDRAYRDILYRLDEIQQELQVLCASPGYRAARAALPPNPAGQVPKERSEAPSYVQ